MSREIDHLPSATPGIVHSLPLRLSAPKPIPVAWPVALLILVCLGGLASAGHGATPAVEAAPRAGRQTVSRPVGLHSDLGPLAGFSEGLAAVAYFRFGYIDRAGQWVILPTYQWGGQFSNGIARVRVGDESFYIDRTGKRVSEETVKRQGPAWEVFKKDGKCGYVDTRTGEIVVEPKYDDAYPFSGGMARVIMFDDGSTRYIDRTGREVIRPDDFTGRDFHEGLAAATWNSDDHAWGSGTVRGWGFIDTTGKFVIRPQYDDVADFSEGSAQVFRNRKSGFIDHAGTVVVPIELGAAMAFSEGLAAAWPTEEQARAMGIEPNVSGVLRDDGNPVPWGYIDPTGKWVIRPQYATAGRFSDGLAHVTADGIDGFIDHTGRVVIDVAALRSRLVLDEEKLRTGEPGPVARPR